MSADDVKETLYSAIDEIGREKIRIETTSDISASARFCSEIIAKCAGKLSSDGESLGTLCEALLHFMLTAAVLPSERKVSFKNAELDIVVPSLKVLDKNPDKCLVIQVIKNDDSSKIMQAISVQPNRENLWIVSAKKRDRGHKNYNIEDASFSQIIVDIHAFLASKGVKNLKLLHG